MMMWWQLLATALGIVIEVLPENLSSNVSPQSQTDSWPRTEDSLRNIAARSVKSLLWTIFWYSLSQSISFLAIGLGFWYGSRLISFGEYDSTQFYTRIHRHHLLRRSYCGFLYLQHQHHQGGRSDELASLGSEDRLRERCKTTHPRGRDRPERGCRSGMQRSGVCGYPRRPRH